MSDFINTCEHCEQAVEVGRGTTGCPYCGSIYHETCWEQEHGCADPKCVGFQMHGPKQEREETVATVQGGSFRGTKVLGPWEIFKSAWGKIRPRLGFFIGMQFVVSLILVSLALVGERSSSALLSYSIVTLYPFVSAFLGAASLNIYLLEHDGKKPTLGDLFYVPNYWRLLWSSFLVGLVVSLGLILLVLPGLFLSVALLFVPMLILDQDATIKVAFIRSYNGAIRNFSKVAGSLILAIILNLAGVLLFGVGHLITLPITIMALTILYRELL